MPSITDYFKPHILKAKKYRPTVFMLAEREPGFIRMMANESNYGPSPKVIEAIKEHLNELNRYPDPGYLELKEKIAQYANLKLENVLVGAGSFELIDMLYRGFIDPGDKVILPTPIYSPYLSRLEIAQGEPILIPMKEPDLDWDMDKIVESIDEKTKMAVFISPNNPTGKVVSKDMIKPVLDTGIITVVDEAYYEYCRKTMAKYINEYENLIVLRTFSKAFGLSGLRIGYMLADEKVVDYLEHLELTFHINRLAVIAAMAALDNLEYLNKVVDETVREREKIFKELSKMPALKPYPSNANFILVKIVSDKYSAQYIQEQLKAKKILVRNYSNVPGLKGDYLRITVGRPKENERFLEELRKILSE
ncbi:MAG: histidinol-phosphate transaminase [Thermoprotei archaeon]|nr:MAG: histidinol-phosphate transaminase [Thermoprotei archaeon]